MSYIFNINKVGFLNLNLKTDKEIIVIATILCTLSILIHLFTFLAFLMTEPEQNVSMTFVAFFINSCKHMINFYIFIVFNKRFRQTFNKYFCSVPWQIFTIFSFFLFSDSSLTLILLKAFLMFMLNLCCKILDSISNFY